MEEVSQFYSVWQAWFLNENMENAESGDHETAQSGNKEMHCDR